MATLDILQNRIDFCGIITAEKCNPNGDPLNGNTPRQDWSGHGVISDVCLKRKIRDRLFDAGYEIFVLKQDDLPDGQESLRDRANDVPEMADAAKRKDRIRYRKIACEKWIDVRAFGQVFAFKEKNGGVSEPVRGPVSIQDAVSLDCVILTGKNITKSVNSNDPDHKSGKASDTFGVQYQIDHGAYVFRGSMYPQLAKTTGFTYDDALAIKKAMITMFQNDASSARPSGSIALDKLYWWEHNCPNGQYSPIKVFRTLKLSPGPEAPFYTAELDNLPGLEPEVIEGW